MDDNPRKPKRSKPAAKKPVPPLLSVLEAEAKPEREKFPVFLGIGIALSIAALVFVATLSFCSKRARVAPPAAAQASATASERKNSQ